MKSDKFFEIKKNNTMEFLVEASRRYYIYSNRGGMGGNKGIHMPKPKPPADNSLRSE